MVVVSMLSRKMFDNVQSTKWIVAIPVASAKLHPDFEKHTDAGSMLDLIVSRMPL